jgi:hypothetical protein
MYRTRTSKTDPSLKETLSVNVTCTLIVTSDDQTTGNVQSQIQAAVASNNITSGKQAKKASIKKQYAGAITASTYSVYIGVIFITLFYGVFILNDSVGLIKFLMDYISKKIQVNNEMRRKYEVLNIERAATVNQVKPVPVVKTLDTINILKMDNQINVKLNSLKLDAKKES